MMAEVELVARVTLVARVELLAAPDDVCAGLSISEAR